MTIPLLLPREARKHDFPLLERCRYETDEEERKRKKKASDGAGIASFCPIQQVARVHPGSCKRNINTRRKPYINFRRNIRFSAKHHAGFVVSQGGR
mmetsp:Transcript_33602/g.49200  ORF Transcript_33602/g.49200 Transcript_33602/m.49200 type:complete len:96 (+) Transcript_33602:88-375(+)